MKASDPFPILYVRDVARSEAFYRDAFGFEGLCGSNSSGPGNCASRETSRGVSAAPTTQIPTGTRFISR